MNEAVDAAARRRSSRDHFFLHQFPNPDHEAHRTGLELEIIAAMDGRTMSSSPASGRRSITGAGVAIKAHNPKAPSSSL